MFNAISIYLLLCHCNSNHSKSVQSHRWCQNIHTVLQWQQYFFLYNLKIKINIGWRLQCRCLKIFYMSCAEMIWNYIQNFKSLWSALLTFRISMTARIIAKFVNRTGNARTRTCFFKSIHNAFSTILKKKTKLNPIQIKRRK